jgi:hypothetical protein
MISDARIVDLRSWFVDSRESATPSGRRIYVCRHVSLRKVTESQGPTALRMQSLWNSEDVLIRCQSSELKPVVRRCPLDENGQPDRYLWEVQLDFTNVAVGETAHLVVETMIQDHSHDPEFDQKEWWRYQVDGSPELATSWILLPEHRRYTNFNLVRYDYQKSERVTIVQPTRQSVIRHGTILNWAVLHPDPEVTYSCRWSLEL